MFGGAVGGKFAAMALSKIGSAALGVAGRALGGALAGGVSDAITQLGTTRRIDWGGVAMSAGIGAVFDAAGGRGGRSGRADAPEAPPSGRGHATADGPAAPRDGSGGSPGCHSFAPTTRVLMADGTTKPIADVNIGDKVTANDPATGKTEAKPVVALHLNRDKELWRGVVHRQRPGRSSPDAPFRSTPTARRRCQGVALR